jgi:antitoxin Phd
MPQPRSTRPTTRWALQDAKNRFSEVVDAALRGQPQVVTRRGVDTAVVVAHEDYARLVAAPKTRPPLAEYLVSRGPALTGEPFERVKLRPRSAV